MCHPENMLVERQSRYSSCLDGDTSKQICFIENEHEEYMKTTPGMENTEHMDKSDDKVIHSNSYETDELTTESKDDMALFVQTSGGDRVLLA